MNYCEATDEGPRSAVLCLALKVLCIFPHVVYNERQILILALRKIRFELDQYQAIL